jgi:porphobilinogen synthase
MSQFPQYRPRRLRRTAALRRMMAETHIEPAQLILPLFAVNGASIRKEIASMPGVFQTSIDELVKDARAAFELGIQSVLLFGIPDTKDATGSRGPAARHHHRPCCRLFVH